MSATVMAAWTDRSDLRTVLIAGTKLGLLVALAVVLYLITARQAPAGARPLVEALLVLVAGAAVTFLPGGWAAARTIEGIAGAAAIGLWGAIVFSVVDVAVLRPAHAYPWTWDAVGGGSSWWYLPVWWMLATFLAWMGGVLVAAQAGRGQASVTRAATPVVAGAVILAAVGGLAGVGAILPVRTGLGFAVVLVGLALVALTRKA
jgi:hypothetical protein